MSAPLCLNCKRPIAKRTISYWIEPPREAKLAQERFVMMGGQKRSCGFDAAVAAKPEGTIERDHSSARIYTANLPRTKEDCKRLVNGEVVSIRRGVTGEVVRSFGVWEGEYVDQHFCSNGCAEKFGRRMARRGARL